VSFACRHRSLWDREPYVLMRTGSRAAAMQARIGNVVVGSMFAVLQSLGARIGL
jgi:hypothetical protein